MKYLKKHGSHLGGQSGQWFMRYVGKDCFIITKDVCLALKNAGVDLDGNPPTSQRDMNKIQNAW